MRNTIMFLFPNSAITERAVGGGGLVMKNHLLLLRLYTEDIHLVLIRQEHEVDEFDLYFSSHVEEFQEIRSLYRTKTALQLSYSRTWKKPWNYIQLIVNPIQFALPFLNKKNRKSLEKIAREISPTVIWAEHSTAAILSCFSLPMQVKKTVYAHHDWEYKLRRLRKKNVISLSYRIRTAIIKFIEIRVIKRVGAIISPSAAESHDCLHLGAKSVMYCPLFVERPSRSNIDEFPKKTSFKLFHLGGMKTTANRIGLENFFLYCWPILKEAIPEIELVIIGSINGSNETLLSFFDDPAIQLLGYVDDVDSVLDPHTIHIIPWDQNTGVRTKLPIAFRNKQVVVGMRRSLLCYAELVDSANVLVADDFHDFINKIIFLYKNREHLHRLGQNAFDTYEDSFTIDAQKERFLNFMHAFG